MKIDTPLEMECFNDGIVHIAFLDEDEKYKAKLKGLHYQDRIIGAVRHFAAAQAQVQINRLIRVPQQRSISPHDVAIIGPFKYDIEQAQHLNDKNPHVTDLTLKQLEMFLEVEGIE